MAVRRDVDPVRQAGLARGMSGAHVQEETRLARHSLSIERIGQQLGAILVRQCQKERTPIGRYRHPIGSFVAAIQQCHLAIGIEPIEAAKIQFTQRRLVGLRQSIRRISEVDRARWRDAQVVGTVEAFAVIAVGEDRALPRAQVHFHDRARPAVGADQRAVGHDRDAVEAGLADRRRHRRLQSGRRQEGGRALSPLPAIDDVGRRIAEQQILALRHPGGPFGPAIAGRQYLHPDVGGNDAVERAIDPIDPRRHGGRSAERAVRQRQRGQAGDEGAAPDHALRSIVRRSAAD